MGTTIRLVALEADMVKLRTWFDTCSEPFQRNSNAERDVLHFHDQGPLVIGREENEIDARNSPLVTRMPDRPFCGLSSSPESEKTGRPWSAMPSV